MVVRAEPAARSGVRAPQKKKGASMGEYRLYWLDEENHIREADTVECANFEEACKAAMARLGKYKTIEIWHGARRLGQVTESDAANA